MQAVLPELGYAAPGAEVARRAAAEPWRRCAAISILALTLAARELAAGQAHVKKSEVAWVAAPAVAIPLAAAPQVACPTEALGDCDFGQRLLIANEVGFQRAHRVAISLFGGLYGS